MPKFLVLLSLLASFSDCAHSQKEVSAVQSIPARNPPPSQAFQSTEPNQETIAVVAINDFHGSLLPKERKLPDGSVVKSGGAEALAGMLQILKKEMHGKVAIIDAGDEWQGTMESNLTQGETVVQFYNRIGVNAAAIGNHEFDFGRPSMLRQFQKAHFPYLASNIELKKSKTFPRWNHVKKSALFNVVGYRIGVIGVSTQSTPTTTRFEYVSDLKFTDAVKPVTSESKKLRAQGANLILITAHAGTRCEDQNGLREWKIWQESTLTSACDEDQEIVKLIHGLKPGSVDGVIAGHTHQVMHHFIDHVPVVQDEAYNQFFNVMYFTFDRATRKLIPELTRLEGPIPICFDFFAGTDHCDVRRLSANTSPKLEKAFFHGQAILPDAEIEAWLKPIQASTQKYREQVVGVTELPLIHTRDAECPFSNWMADVLREKSHADFGLVNSGGTRASLDAGPITYDGLYRALPFDNLLNVVQMTGAQIKLAFRLATSGTRGIPGVSGAKITLIPFAERAPQTDLNQDGKLENWETNRMLKIETSSGKEIEDQKIYTLATYDFLVTGGDDMKFVMDQIPKQHVFLTQASSTRDLAVDYLKTHPIINTKLHPTYDPKNPRILYIHP